jgi:hypothetical protein
MSIISIKSSLILLYHDLGEYQWEEELAMKEKEGEEDLLKHITVTPCYRPFKSPLYIISIRPEHLQSFHTRLFESIILAILQCTKFRSWSRGWRRRRRRGGRRWRRRSRGRREGWGIPGRTMIFLIYRSSWSWWYMIMTRWVFEFI